MKRLGLLFIILSALLKGESRGYNEVFLCISCVFYSHIPPNNTMNRMYMVDTVKIDRNQPHVLKYAAEDKHTGVELHHDKCDLTANIMLSRSCSYSGGG